MLKNQENSEKPRDEELEAIAGWRLDDLVKDFSLRSKVARWVAVAVSIVAISVGMNVPSQAVKRERRCDKYQVGTLLIYQGKLSYQEDEPTMCLSETDTSGQLMIAADVYQLWSGANDGYIVTNKGQFSFTKRQSVDFIEDHGGTVTILRIHIDGK